MSSLLCSNFGCIKLKLEEKGFRFDIASKNSHSKSVKYYVYYKKMSGFVAVLAVYPKNSYTDKHKCSRKCDLVLTDIFITNLINGLENKSIDFDSSILGYCYIDKEVNTKCQHGINTKCS